MKIYISLKIVSSYEKAFTLKESEVVTFTVIGQFGTYWLKLAYDGVLQLTNCFVLVSVDVKILRLYEKCIQFYKTGYLGKISRSRENWKIHLVTSSKAI